MIRQNIFLFNPNRCLGCKTCQMACSIHHNLPPGVFLRKVELVEYSRSSQIIKYYISTSCHHCINPECIRLCPERAFRKRRDGIIVYNQTQCSGCGTCIRSCPFEAPVMNPLNGKVIKCDMCFGRIEEGERPYCVASCPVEALKIIDPQNVHLEGKEIRASLQGLPRIKVTKPSVRYVNIVMGKQIFRNKVTERMGM